MFDRLNCFGLLLVVGLFATAFGFYRTRKHLERVAAHLTEEVDATDDFADRLDGRLDALFEGVKQVEAKADAIDAYVQELPTFDDLAASERGQADVLVLRLRELADAIERDAHFEVTQEDLEAGRVTFDDGTRLEDLIPGIFVPSRLAEDDLPGPALTSDAEVGFELLVLPCDCAPGEPKCVPPCMPEAAPGVSESIIGTVPAAEPAPASPRSDDCTCGG